MLCHNNLMHWLHQKNFGIFIQTGAQKSRDFAIKSEAFSQLIDGCIAGVWELNNQQKKCNELWKGEQDGNKEDNVDDEQEFYKLFSSFWSCCCFDGFEWEVDVISWKDTMKLRV